MSTIKTINLQHPSSANSNIVMDASGNMTVAGTVNAAGSTFTANSTVVNAVSYYAGTTLIANTTGPYGRTQGALNVNSATYATSAGSATNASAATNATYATSAGSATNATYATSAGSATNATYATSAGSATNATHLNSTSANYVTPVYNNGANRSQNTWLTMPYNGFITIRAIGAYMNNIEVYTSPNGGTTSYSIALIGDDYNSNSKGSYVGFPLKAGSAYYVQNPGYNAFAGGSPFETLTIWEWWFG